MEEQLTASVAENVRGGACVSCTSQYANSRYNNRRMEDKMHHQDHQLTIACAA